MVDDSLGRLARLLTQRELRNALKRSYRAEAKKVVAIARRGLSASGLAVKGSRADLERGVRSRVYSRGGGFLVTVKPRKAGRNGRGERSMHKNRFGLRKPVLLWAEEGTEMRYSRRARYWRKAGKRIFRGRMGAYGFLKGAAPEMFRTVEADLAPEVRRAVEAVARKSGVI